MAYLCQTSLESVLETTSLASRACYRDVGAWLWSPAGNSGKVCDSFNRKVTPVDSRLSSLASLVSSRPTKEYASKPTPPPKKLRTAFEELPKVGL